MRILNLRFKNLNSLAGEWEIDLMHPAYATDGIFAITGPTGAGKTTILDALCLALYGRTPRLERVNQNGNEVMSRLTGECFAEVTFETQKGRFRCHWSQRRAYGKPDGDLQPQKHEISEAFSGKILASKLTDTGGRIEKTTGMDFGRFTRSMLLAQGGFSVFLQADPDKRAPILEQITGTEKYSLISKRVHERFTVEKNRLNVLQAELESTRVMTGEEEQQLSRSLHQKINEEEVLTLSIHQKNTAIAWIEGMLSLEKELSEILCLKKDLDARTEAFKKDQSRLETANKALELAAEHASLAAARKEQEADRFNLRKCQESLPAIIKAANQSEEEMKTTSSQLSAGKNELQKLQPVFRKTRELDLQIAGLDEQMKSRNQSIQELEDSMRRLRIRYMMESDELSKCRFDSDRIGNMQESTKDDAALIESLTGLMSRFDTLTVFVQRLGKKTEGMELAREQYREAESFLQERINHLEIERGKKDAIQTELSEKQKELEKLMGDRDSEEWHRVRTVLSELGKWLSDASDAYLSLAESRQAALILRNRKDSLSTEKSELNQALSLHLEKQSTLERELELLDNQLILLRKIESLDEARRQLQDGEPCPLCGSGDHPFARGNVPAPDDTLLRLIEVKNTIRSIRETVSGMQVRQAKIEKDFEQNESGIDKHTSDIEEASGLIRDICSKLPQDMNLMPSDPDLGNKLKEYQSENQRQLETILSKLETAGTIEKELIRLRSDLERANQNLIDAEREAQGAQFRIQTVRVLLDRMKVESEELRDQQDELFNRLQQEIQMFKISIPSVKDLEEVQAQLISRRDRWISLAKEKHIIDKKIVSLEIQISERLAQIRNSEDESGKLQKLSEALSCEREAFLRERHELFGDRNPDIEESLLLSGIETLDEKMDEVRQACSAAQTTLIREKAKAGDLELAIEFRDRKLRAMDDEFRNRLQEAGFSDEEKYMSACLPENERRRLALQSQNLATGRTEIIAKERELVKRLETERLKKMTGESLQDLKQSLQDLVGNQRDLQQEIGGIRQKLKDNDGLKQQQQERIRNFELQETECSRWASLHELIGSADGKKYRNFAQGLTFEIMIGHANRQLQKMSDRYLLVKDGSNPLEINVIDNYQAAEIRSTKNLSGGESFIVSLALALGLSHMASRNVRLDSLFLDEGFGTLDEDALDIALETLAGLRQDGKLIGIISHVPELKERIGTRIEVIPQNGGRSILQGPGCRNIR